MPGEAQLTRNQKKQQKRRKRQKEAKNLRELQESTDRLLTAADTLLAESTVETNTPDPKKISSYSTEKVSSSDLDTLKARKKDRASQSTIWQFGKIKVIESGESTSFL